jgi:hypothetical protein
VRKGLSDSVPQGVVGVSDSISWPPCEYIPPNVDDVRLSIE